MRIVLVRHGESEGNVNGARYADVGDPPICLTAEGQSQLRSTGIFLRHYYNSTGRKGLTAPQRIWVSPFARAEQSAALALEAFRDVSLDICRDRRLVEQNFGLIPYIAYQKNPKHDELIRALVEISKEVASKDPFLAAPPFGESPAAQHVRVMDFLRLMDAERDEQGIEDVCIVSHGGTGKHIIMDRMKLPFTAWKEIALQNNGDVTVIEDKGKGYQVRKIYDGPSRRSVMEDPLVNVRRRPFAPQ